MQRSFGAEGISTRTLDQNRKDIYFFSLLLLYWIHKAKETDRPYGTCVIKRTAGKTE